MFHITENVKNEKKYNNGKNSIRMTTAGLRPNETQIMAEVMDLQAVDDDMWAEKEGIGVENADLKEATRSQLPVRCFVIRIPRARLSW